MKYLKRFNEELTSNLIPCEYELKKQDNLISYLFKFGGYNFILGFSKYTGQKSEECSIWSRNFETRESEFDSLNISNTSALKIYGMISYLTEIFIEDYNPDIIEILHTTESRFRINKIFINKIGNDYLKKKVVFNHSDGFKVIKTVLIKEEFLDFYPKYSSRKLEDL